MSQPDPALYRLSEKIAELKFTDLMPFNGEAQEETREFLQKIVDLLIDYVELSFNRDEPVIDFHQPECLKKKFDMEIASGGHPLQQLVEDCTLALRHQVKSGHPRFMNQLSTGLDIISMAGDWLTATANSNTFTYEVSPVFVTMEGVVLQKMRDVIGFTTGDSVFAPGGTICNLYALILARFKKFPEIKTKGYLGAAPGELVMFTSANGHYSIKIACSITGVGIENCIHIECDEQDRMIPAELEKAIEAAKEAGKVPFLVNATSGTTVAGAFDPLNEIADICEKHEIWLHVDAAWGGGLMLSSKYRHPRFTGVERADSLTWNPHKLMGTTLQCSSFHVKHDNILWESNKMGAEYLFMTDKIYDNQLDIGDKTIQCGRHNDVFKLWLQWRARGDSGFEKRVDRLMELAEYQVKRIKEQSDKFRLIFEPNFVNVCFWYIPKSLRDVPHDAEKEEKLGAICPRIKGRMMKAGTLMVGYQRHGKIPNFFRSVISQEALTEEDIDFMLNEIDRWARIVKVNDLE